MKSLPSILVVLLLPWVLAGSPIAHYSFDGVIEDLSGNGYDPDFQVIRVSTDPANATFTAGGTDQAIHLDYREGLMMPMEITDALMASHVWVFEMRFKITTWNRDIGGQGGRRLVSINRSGTGAPPFFELRANVLNETGVRLELLMRDGEGTIIRQSFSDADLNEWIDMTLIVDFEQGRSIYYADGFFQANVFEYFDYDNFRNEGAEFGSALFQQPFFVGYYNRLNQNHNNNSNDITGKKLTGDLIIDELKIYDADLPSDLTTFENALQQLTDHLNEVHTLTAEEISRYATDALTNYRGHYPLAKALADAYFEAYEANYEPMFTSQLYRNF